MSFFRHVCGEYLWNCECGWVIAGVVAGIAGVVIAAASAGYSAYAQNQQQAQQREDASNLAKRQAEYDAAAGEARRKQVLYDAKRKQETIRSREAAAGVQIGQGSLLEQEMQFAADAEYAAQLAQLPYQVASEESNYSARLFGNSASRLRGSAGLTTGVAAGGTLATGGGSLLSNYYRRPAPTSPTYGGD